MKKQKILIKGDKIIKMIKSRTGREVVVIDENISTAMKNFSKIKHIELNKQLILAKPFAPYDSLNITEEVLTFVVNAINGIKKDCRWKKGAIVIHPIEDVNVQLAPVSFYTPGTQILRALAYYTVMPKKYETLSRIRI